jgi:rare lipoprotein A
MDRSASPRLYACLKSAAATLLLVLGVAVAPCTFAVELERTLDVIPDASPAEAQTGVASYYSNRFEGRRTASGEPFRNSEMIAAHGSHPFGTVVRVTNIDRGTSVVVRIADRFATGVRRAGASIIDLSQAAASRIGLIAKGRAKVLVEVLEWGNDEQPSRSGRRTASRD